jgi:hypothetical protein
MFQERRRSTPWTKKRAFAFGMWNGGWRLAARVHHSDAGCGPTAREEHRGLENEGSLTKDRSKDDSSAEKENLRGAFSLLLLLGCSHLSSTSSASCHRRRRSTNQPTRPHPSHQLNSTRLYNLPKLASFPRPVYFLEMITEWFVRSSARRATREE